MAGYLYFLLQCVCISSSGHSPTVASRNDVDNKNDGRGLRIVCTVWSRLQATYSTQCTQFASWLSNITTVTTGQINICSENAVWPPEDGRKDARNMLRNKWLTIKSLIVASSWSHIYLLIKDARSLKHKVHKYDIQYASTIWWYVHKAEGGLPTVQWFRNIMSEVFQQRSWKGKVKQHSEVARTQAI
jgi:hypothetical protein